MKENSKKLLAAFLALMTVVSVFTFASCGNDPQETGEKDEKQEEETEDPNVVPTVDLSDYKAVYSAALSKTTASEVKARIASVNKKFGTKIQLSTDFDPTEIDGHVDNNDKEILIGLTNRKESAEQYENLDVTKYGIKAVGNKILVYGKTEEALMCAIQKFFGMLDEAEEISLRADTDIVIDYFLEQFDSDDVISILVEHYHLITPEGGVKSEVNLATSLRDRLYNKTGKSMAISSEARSFDYEVLVGDVRHGYNGPDDLDYYDYSYGVKNGQFFLSGGSSTAIGWAVPKFVQWVVEEAKGTDDYEKTVRFDTSNFNPIAKNIDLFVPVWKDSFTPPTWLSDFEEKTFAVTCPQDGDYRITTKAHRGDWENYPENSLEAYASAIKMGVDSVEIDVQMTKDGIAVCMHDGTLNRTTDAAKYVGKAGYPTDYNVSSWTYEQLQVLRLYDGRYKASAASRNLTDCKVPTLYEALELCADRIFVQVDDKTSSFNTLGDLYVIAEATHSKKSMMHYYMTYISKNLLNQWVSLNKADTDFAAYVERVNKYIAMEGHALRKVFWPNDTNTWNNDTLYENEEYWEKLTSNNHYMIWCENSLVLIRYMLSIGGKPTLTA